MITVSYTIRHCYETRCFPRLMTPQSDTLGKSVVPLACLQNRRTRHYWSRHRRTTYEAFSLSVTSHREYPLFRVLLMSIFTIFLSRYLLEPREEHGVRTITIHTTACDKESASAQAHILVTGLATEGLHFTPTGISFLVKSEPPGTHFIRVLQWRFAEGTKSKEPVLVKSA